MKTALVTGSSNGIGEGIVKELAKLNYKLVVTGRSAEDIARVANECESLSPSKLKPLEVVADLGDEDQVNRLFKLAMEHFDNRLNLLVNNAGFVKPTPPEDIEACYESYKKTLQVNLHATVRLTLLATPVLKQTAIDSGEGQTSCIINMSSIASKRPSMTLSAYATSKAAMHIFSESMSIELAPLIRVNLISPGPVETKIIDRAGLSLDEIKEKCCTRIPIGRIGYVEDVVKGVLFLADHQSAGYITGADLTIDGGTILAPLSW